MLLGVQAKNQATTNVVFRNLRGRDSHADELKEALGKPQGFAARAMGTEKPAMSADTRMQDSTAQEMWVVIMGVRLAIRVCLYNKQ